MKIKLNIGQNDQLVTIDRGARMTQLRYGQWRDDPRGECLVPGYLSYSDYSGSLVEKSNHDAWLEKFSDGLDVWWWEAIGGHGTCAVVIKLPDVPDEEEEDVGEFLNHLQVYHLADEDLHSKLESEAQDEAWKNWARRDFVRAIEKKFKVTISDDEVDDELLLTIFHESAEKANEYWGNQEGPDVYIDVDKIAKKVTREDLEQIGHYEKD
jgi:hypothetical protein